MAATTKPHVSSFLYCGENTQEEELAILHLKRDNLIPTVLRSHDANDEGYDEGRVTNTRFGSFPHTTLIGVPWGSQMRASAVDTGSRGRRGEKRKREDSEKNQEEVTHEALENVPDVDATEMKSRKVATEAQSGFVHLLPPTPERWTGSLPHRTQLVYTPDYSYILHRIKARPGGRLIEAGAGSGSFTHAAARAVFNGYAFSDSDPSSYGKIYSYEFHTSRAEKLEREIHDHRLDGIVELTARDVCNDGFTPSISRSSSINGTSIFLDLPAPWLALKHLTRDATDSPLNPNAAVHLCSFSPCIEQVQRTVNTLRQLGWVEVEMVELAAKRIEVRRERVGIHEEGQRGVNDNPATVDEALVRLREQEFRERTYRSDDTVSEECAIPSKQKRLQELQNAHADRKLYNEGRLVTRSEPELKTHTSYLVFAVLPRYWTEEDEARAMEQWPEHAEMEEMKKPMGRKARKRAAKAAKMAAEDENHDGEEQV